MFKRIDGLAPAATITLVVDGRRIAARDGDTVAMALLAAGVVPFRHTPVSGEPRSPLCLMGSCFDCLVEVDGGAPVQACMLGARDGMQLHLPTGARPATETGAA